METNSQLELAKNFLQFTGTNIFLTGKAGTGKTTFLRTLKEISPKRMIVVAPTGVAAINAGGVTIHSFFQLPFGPYIPEKMGTSGGDDKKGQNRQVNKFSKEKVNIIRSLDLLVIDEISMVRADLLDAVSDVLCRYKDRSKPFGGLQLLLIGDLQQLAPVVKDDEWSLLKEYYESAFFFHSRALRGTSYVSIELNQVYRQSDTTFVDLLNKIRDNRVDESTLQKLNERYVKGFDPDDAEGYIILTTHNYQAQRINTKKLDEVDAKAYTYPAEIKGDFPVYSFPTDDSLTLKKGAQVMFVKNDSSPEKRYFNGKIGLITTIGTDRIVVKSGGEQITVELEEWTNTKYAIDADTKEIVETVEGTFKQYPLKTAWAITIHKSQGLTFEHAIVDASAAFSHGQVYVALSRCKTFEGLVLSSLLSNSAVINDTTVQHFTEYLEHNQPDQELLGRARLVYFWELLTEMFDYKIIQSRLQYMAHLFYEHLQKLYPELAERYYRVRDESRKDLLEVGERFKSQLYRLVTESLDCEQDDTVHERIVKGVAYFKEKTESLVVSLLDDTDPEIDNQEVRKNVADALIRLRQDINVKILTLTASEKGFSVKHYLEAKAKAMIEKEKAKMKKPSEKVEVSKDILHPQLYNMLRVWRKELAEKQNLPAYTVLQQKALLGITNTLPASGKDLAAIQGIGKKIIEKYGVQLLTIVDKYRFNS